MPVTTPPDVPDLFDMELAGRVVDYARERGLNPDTVLERLDIDPADLGRAEIYLDAEQFYRLQVDLADALGDTTFGFGLAEFLLLSNYGLIGVLHQKSDNVAAAMHHTAALLPRFLVARIGISEDAASFTITYFNEHNDDITWVHRQEVIGGMVLNTRKTTGAETQPLALRLRDTHASVAQIRAVLGVTAEIGADVDEVVFPLDVVQIPSKTADPITLPFLFDAVEAQVQRRRAWVGQRATLLQLDGCTVDLASGRVQRPGGAAWLTSRERELLEFFAARRNQVVTHTEIEQAIWHLGSAVISHAPAVAIRRLRQKIEPKGSRPVNLLTMFGDGWKLVVRT